MKHLQAVISILTTSIVLVFSALTVAPPVVYHHRVTHQDALLYDHRLLGFLSPHGDG